MSWREAGKDSLIKGLPIYEVQLTLLDVLRKVV